MLTRTLIINYVGEDLIAQVIFKVDRKSISHV